MIQRRDRPTRPTSKLQLGYWTAFYREQARLIWAWRATRLSLIRRAMFSYVGTTAALLLITSFSRDLTIQDPRTLLIAAFLLTVLNAAARPVLLLALSPLPTLVVQLAGVAVQFVFVLLVADLLPGANVGSVGAAIVDAVMLSVLNALLAELMRASDDDSYHGTQVRRLAARTFGEPEAPTAGLLMVQIDGLGLEVLRNAMRAGRMPFLDGLIRDGTAKLDPWVALLPPVTPVSQAGILHGNNDEMPGFRWFDKGTGRLLAANTPEGAAAMLHQVSDGRGLLTDDGASIGNLVTGDAARSYLTMATIEDRSDPGDPRRLRGLYISQVNYLRLLVLTIGEVIKELYQRERQRARGIEPRIHRNVSYAFERALTNVALRNLTTALVIEEMFGGAPSIYVDYTGYDALAHHVGPERDEAFDALDGLDRTIGSLLKAARETPRPYRLVVLSDHGQCLGTPFSQRYGELLEDVARRLMGVEARDGVHPDDEFRHARSMILGELGRGPSIRARAARLAHRHRAAAAMSDDPGELVACASGNLALLYLTVEPGRLDREEIDRRYPDLIPGLLAHPGVAFVLVHSGVDGALVLGRDGSNHLTTGHIVGRDPLASAGPYAAESLRRIDGFGNAGDICVIGPYDERSGDVVSYEDLVGSHGGLGGRQAEPFLLHPADLSIGDAPIVGAPAVHAVLRRWLAILAGGAPAPERDEPVGGAPAVAPGAAHRSPARVPVTTGAGEPSNGRSRREVPSTRAAVNPGSARSIPEGQSD
jgi:uncharacterized membrane protein YvlD (DUF360 family)